MQISQIFAKLLSEKTLLFSVGFTLHLNYRLMCKGRFWTTVLVLIGRSYKHIKTSGLTLF